MVNAYHPRAGIEGCLSRLCLQEQKQREAIRVRDSEQQSCGKRDHPQVLCGTGRPRYCHNQEKVLAKGNSLLEERYIFTHSFRGFLPRLTGSVALGLR